MGSRCLSANLNRPVTTVLWRVREEDTDGYLGGSEGHEVNRREQAKIVGTEPQFRRQRGRPDRVDGPEQIGDEKRAMGGDALEPQQRQTFMAQVYKIMDRYCSGKA